MVSVYPNTPPNQGFTHFYGFHMGGDPMKTPGMNRSENDLLQEATIRNVDSVVDDPSKKIRKPYTITKSRESWSDQEHDKFLEALHLFDRDWKKIEAFVGSKTVIQIRSHAQKYFMKVQKNGTSEHVPPPRPKRKAAHPYPQKAPKNVASQAKRSVQSTPPLLEAGYAVRPDSLSVSRNPIGGPPLSSCTYNVVQTGSLSHVSEDDIRLASAANNCSSSSNESTRRAWIPNETGREVRKCNRSRVTPDFAQVYGFIGSVFDSGASDHLKRLKMMDPIDVETVLMLMKNLCVNLMSPEFEDHRRLISSYSAGIKNDSVESGISSA